MTSVIPSPVLVRAPSGTMLVHAAFVLTGVMTTLLGPMLPVFFARWALSDSQAGYLFTAQFATSILGVAISSALVQRYGYRLTLVFGLGFMALGAGVLAHASWILGLVSVCVYGFGLGLTIPTANLLIAKLHPDRRAAALNLLNFSWGIGAVGCPFVVAALQLGRALAPLILRHVRETTLASAGLVLASLGILVLLIANTMALVVAGASVAGFGLASVFPINIALLSQWFGEMASRIGGMMFALSSLGGATVPWLVGALSSRFGSLRVGLTVPLLGSITMLFLYLKNRQSHRLT